MTQHKRCDNCNTILDGGSIWNHFFARSNSESEADYKASLFGASREHGNWNRAIAVYDKLTDHTSKWRCPDCNYEWSSL